MRSTTTTTEPTCDSTTTTPIGRHRVRRLGVVTTTAAALVGLGTLGTTLLTGTDPSHPAVVVSQASAHTGTTTPTPAAPAVDIERLWQTILELDADQVAVIVPALDAQVRADLEAIVRAVAGTAAG